MLVIISATALEPCGPDGAAPLSACKKTRKAAVRIVIHLNIHGIRRDGGFQVIDMVRGVGADAGAGARRGLDCALSHADCQARSARLPLILFMMRVKEGYRGCS
jgi:hypothetical protein